MQRCDSCGNESERLSFTPPDLRWLCSGCKQPKLARSTTGTSFIRGAGEPVAGRDYAVVKRKGY